jgi:hypothetical protein
MVREWNLSKGKGLSSPSLSVPPSLVLRRGPRHSRCVPVVPLSPLLVIPGRVRGGEGESGREIELEGEKEWGSCPPSWSSLLVPGFGAAAWTTTQQADARPFVFSLPHSSLLAPPFLLSLDRSLPLSPSPPLILPLLLCQRFSLYTWTHFPFPSLLLV